MKQEIRFIGTLWSKFQIRFELHDVQWRWVGFIHPKTSATAASQSSQKQSKAVPLHAMVALGGERWYSSYSFLTSATIWGWVVSVTPRPRFVSGKGPPVPIVQEAGWTPLCPEDRGKILCPCRGSNPCHPVVQSVVTHYTDWATSAPRKVHKVF
jgi:hypothetical protein